MRLDRRGSWTDTRRELGQLAWAVLLIDAIAVGLGALASRPMGPVALTLGYFMAGFATVVFVSIVASSLLAEYVVHLWVDRRGAGKPVRGGPAGGGR